MTKDEKKLGRPKGAKTQEKVFVYQDAPRCPSCGSSERSAFFGSRVQHDIDGERDGRPYNLIIVRRCRCIPCGQVLMVKTYELTRKPRSKK